MGTDFTGDTFLLSSENHSPDDEERKREKRYQSHWNAVAEHDNVGTDNRCHGNQAVFGAVMGDLCNLKEIVCHPAHQMTCLGMVIVTEAQLLKMREKVLSHVVFHIHTKLMAPSDSDVRKTGLNGIDSEHRNEADHH